MFPFHQSEDAIYAPHQSSAPIHKCQMFQGNPLGCGASVVDANKCIGCGVCTTKCEFDAIHLFRENPDCSRMVKSEDKMKAILPYAAKRAIKIKFGRKEK